MTDEEIEEIMQAFNDLKPYQPDSDKWERWGRELKEETEVAERLFRENPFACLYPNVVPIRDSDCFRIQWEGRKGWVTLTTIPLDKVRQALEYCI